jgi:hypothetical protein
MERGSDKHGARLDDALAAEVEGAMRGEHSTRAEEWRDPEPSGEDQPDVDLAPDGTLVGGTPPGMDESDVSGRAEIASYLGQHVYPADRQQLIAAAAERNAPDRVRERLQHLPDGRRYHNVQDVWTALGGGVEDHRY